MAILIAYPWLALIPALGFLALFSTSRRVLVLVAAGAWAVYGVYEYAMKARWLCSGECNIRVDLLAIYPGLVILSVLALLRALRNAPPSR